jgi:hypothetical protein
MDACCWRGRFQCFNPSACGIGANCEDACQGDIVFGKVDSLSTRCKSSHDPPEPAASSATRSRGDPGNPLPLGGSNWPDTSPARRRLRGRPRPSRNQTPPHTRPTTRRCKESCVSWQISSVLVICARCLDGGAVRLTRLKTSATRMRSLLNRAKKNREHQPHNTNHVMQLRTFCDHYEFKLPLKRRMKRTNAKFQFWING